MVPVEWNIPDFHVRVDKNRYGNLFIAVPVFSCPKKPNLPPARSAPTAPLTSAAAIPQPGVAAVQPPQNADLDG